MSDPPVTEVVQGGKTYKFKFMDGMQVGFGGGHITRFAYDESSDCYAFFGADQETPCLVVPKQNLTLLMIEDGPATVGIGDGSNLDAKHIEGEVAKAGMSEEIRQKFLLEAGNEASRYIYRRDADLPVIIDSGSPTEVWRVKADGHEPTIRELLRLANAAHDRERMTEDQKKREADSDIVIAIVVKDVEPVMSMGRALFDEWMRSGAFRSVLSPIVENPVNGEQYNFAFQEDGQVVLRRCILTTNNARRHEITTTTVAP